MLKIGVLVICIAVLLYGLHRLALGMEGRGWVYYKTSGSSSSRTNAFLSVQSIFEPDKQHILEQRHWEEDDGHEGESGAPPTPGLKPSDEL